MSWEMEERIGECRPWPAQVIVYRGETDECLAYVSGEVADQLKAENAKLRDLCRDLEFCRGHNCLTCSHGRFCDLRINERYDELGVAAE